jgi:uncharacterized membrane protein/protein-disulfide isomerase
MNVNAEWLTLSVILALSLIGMYTCRLIILHLMNRDSPIGAKLCKAGGIFDCDKVLGSRLGMISKNIHWGDVGLVYFIAQALYIVVECINGRTAECIGMITFPCLLAFGLSIVSLVYQAFLIKAWCKMCLITVCIVWLQAIVLVAKFVMGGGSTEKDLVNHFLQGNLLPSILMFGISLVLASAWFLMKTALLAAGEVKATKKKLSLFKKNPIVFKALLKGQPTTNTDGWEDDFLLGERIAPTQLMVALNPYCPPCAREYEEILKLLKMFPGSLGVTIRFPMPADIQNKTTRTVRYLLHAYAHTPKDEQPRILARWFASLSLEDLEKLYPDGITDQNELLSKHRQWSADSKIGYTPTLFINGHEIPRLFYTVADLALLMPKLSKRPLRFATMK